MSIGDEMIKAEAKRLRETIAGGKVWGIPVQPGDADAELVAAYYVGVMSQNLDLPLLGELREWVVTDNGTPILHKHLGYPFP